VTPRTARAAVFDGTPHAISLQSMTLPELVGTEVLVRILGCTLCGSDLHTYEGRRNVPIPTILGHEIVGEIVEFGPAAVRVDLAGRALEFGDRVTWAIVAHCGHCVMCRNDLPQKCLAAIKYGHEALRPRLEWLGGFAEYCLLVAGTSLVKLPEALPLEVVCPTSCATATIAAALEAAGDLQDRHVALCGAGMLGLTACAMARCRGAASVTCVDPSEPRRALAERFGATQVVRPAEFAALAPRSFGEVGLDVVLELSGQPSAFEAAWPLVRTGGTLVLVGSVFPSAPVSLALEQVVRRQLMLRGVHNYAPRHLLAAVEFLTKHGETYPFAELVAGWYPLSRIHDAMTAGSGGTAIRIGVRPDGLCR
jgi:alcohol dehydrogenase